MFIYIIYIHSQLQMLPGSSNDMRVTMRNDAVQRIRHNALYFAESSQAPPRYG